MTETLVVLASLALMVGFGLWVTNWRCWRWSAEWNREGLLNAWRGRDEQFFRRISRNVRVGIVGSLIWFWLVTAAGMPPGCLSLAPIFGLAVGAGAHFLWARFD